MTDELKQACDDYYKTLKNYKNSAATLGDVIAAGDFFHPMILKNWGNLEFRRYYLKSWECTSRTESLG
jgi:hypothetical protein